MSWLSLYFGESQGLGATTGLPGCPSHAPHQLKLLLAMTRASQPDMRRISA